jgi:hypothetical protein
MIEKDIANAVPLYLSPLGGWVLFGLSPQAWLRHRLGLPLCPPASQAGCVISLSNISGDGAALCNLRIWIPNDGAATECRPYSFFAA